jgi:hypothetical protein
MSIKLIFLLQAFLSTIAIAMPLDTDRQRIGFSLNHRYVVYRERTILRIDDSQQNIVVGKVPYEMVTYACPSDDGRALVLVNEYPHSANWISIVWRTGERTEFSTSEIPTLLTRVGSPPQSPASKPRNLFIKYVSSQHRDVVLVLDPETFKGAKLRGDETSESFDLSSDPEMTAVFIKAAIEVLATVPDSRFVSRLNVFGFRDTAWDIDRTLTLLRKFPPESLNCNPLFLTPSFTKITAERVSGKGVVLEVDFPVRRATCEKEMRVVRYEHEFDRDAVGKRELLLREGSSDEKKEFLRILDRTYLVGKVELVINGIIKGKPLEVEVIEDGASRGSTVIHP